MLNRTLASLLCLLGIGAAAPADALAVRFTGVIDEVFDAPLGNPLGLAVGQAFSAIVSFPTDVSAPVQAFEGDLYTANLLQAPPASAVSQFGAWQLGVAPTWVYDPPVLDVLVQDGADDIVGIRFARQDIPG